MKKLLSITPHLSTGGQPQVLVKRVELVKDDLDIYVVEFNNYSNDFVIQKNRLKKLLKPDHFFTLGDNKSEILDIINKVQPDFVHFEEIPELFNIDFNLAKQIYKKDRKYKIFETTHSSDYNVDDKIFFPDKFLFVSQYNCFKFNKFGIPTEVIEYPVEKKKRDPKRKEEAMKKIGLDPNFKHVVNVGLFTPRKNQAHAFEIARLLKDCPVKFHFIGNQADNFQDYWRPLLKIKPKNCILWNERDDVDDFLDACDLFLFTSRGFRWNKELNPLVIKEALEHQLPQFIFPLDVYNRKYDTEDTVHYLHGDVEIDAGLVRNFLFPSDIKTDKKYKIRIVHLLLEEDDRKADPIKGMEKLKEYGIDYVQHINKRFTGTPPREMCSRPQDVGRIGAYALRGPHYGHYTSFRKAIFNEFTDDVDFLMVMEADCKLTIPMDEFVDKIMQVCDEMNARRIYYFSFGDNRNLRTGEMVSDNHGQINEWMYITNKIIATQCVMFPKFGRDFMLRSFETELWDVGDLYFNNIFRYKAKGIAPRLTTQKEGYSAIQGESIEHFLLKNLSNLLKDKNPNDIIVEFNKEDQKFHFCLSDFYQNDIDDISIVVNADNNKNIYTVKTKLSPMSPTWIQIYGHQKYNEFSFDFYHNQEYLFNKKLTINLTPDSENVRKELHEIVEKETDRMKNIKVDEIPSKDDFELDFKIGENKLYLPYKGNLKDVFLDIRVKNIETKDNVFTVDGLRFNNNEYINWIQPGQNLYLSDPTFCGFEVDYLRDDKILFTHQLRLRNKNEKIEEPKPLEFKKIDSTKDTKNLFVVLTYPDTKIKEFTTDKCLNNLRESNLRILLASHYPVSKNLQEKADYYLYDSYNPLISHTLYNFYWSEMQNGKVEIRLDKLQKKSNLNQSLTVLTNIENAIKFAKTAGYDNIVSVSYDFILNNSNIELINNILNKMKEENKKGYFMRYKEGDMTLYKSVFFMVNVDFYTKVFDKKTRTPEEYNAECQRVGAHNFLENYFYNKLSPYTNDLIIEDTDEEKLFKNPNINIFSGVEYLAILPIKDQPASFMVWFNSSNNKDDRRIEFTYDNNGNIEKSTHFIKNRTFYSKKISLKDGDNYNITASFIDSASQQEVDKQTFNINIGNYQDILENGLFTERNEIKEIEIEEIKVKDSDIILPITSQNDSVDITFNIEENKIYFTYKGKDAVSYDIWVVDIDSYFPIFSSNIEFSEYNRNYWIFAGEPLYKMYDQFNGYKILFKDVETKRTLFEKDIKLRENPPICPTKFEFETPCLEFRNYFEAFYDEVWRDLNLNDKDTCVVDLGSGVGTFVAYALKKGCRNVIGVEVDDKCYKSTLNTFKNNTNVSFINKAIYSESNKELTFHFWATENTTYAGTLIEDWIKNEHDAGNIITKKVKTITIDDIIRMYNISKINAMKIDIEGGEYELFDKISEFTLSKIDRILLEFHMNTDNRLDKVIDKMTKNGFKHDVYKMRSKFLNNKDININEGLGMGTVIFYR